jgi:glutaminase
MNQKMNYKILLDEIAREIEPLRNVGKSADYIPALARVDANQFGMSLITIDGETFSTGQAETRFSIQSISKVFALALCLSIDGDNIWARVGKEPSGSAFNSLVQIELEHGFPRNPFINAGALVIADRLVTLLDNPEQKFLAFVRALASDDTVDYCDEVATSERSQGYMNAAIANLLKYHGNLHNDIERVLRFYFLQCSVEMSCRQLAHSFLPFADHHKDFRFGDVCLTTSNVKRLNALMQTCGFYDEAGEFSYLVGLPGKSGVGGGIAAVCPGKYSVAVWSPRLNAKGNSVRGMKALELLTTHTEVSVF